VFIYTGVGEGETEDMEESLDKEEDGIEIWK
jgi:hypothetical protein